MQTTVPVVMCFSGLDSTGGAGIQADIETLASHGCHTCPVVTTITVQDTQDVQHVQPVDATLLIEQARAVLEDIRVSAFKIGLLGNAFIIESIHTILKDYPNIPVILDPVLASGAGTSLTYSKESDDKASSNQVSGNEVIDAITSLLLPLATVITPNVHEARALAPEADNNSACAMAILDHGCEFVLITGTHDKTPEVINTLYGNNRQLETFHWERLPNSYHGSGCTLASSIAGLLAQGNEPLSAIREAQEYTWDSLKHGYRIGMGQHFPNRFFWATPAKK